MKRIVYISIFLLGLWLSFLCGRSVSGKQSVEIIKTDTLVTEVVRVVIDTQYVDKPVPYKVEVRDTLYIRDTVRPFLLIETKRYTDNKTFDMQISGIDAQVDWIRTYPKVVYRDVVRTEYVLEKPKHWSLYVQADMIAMGHSNMLNLGGGLSYEKDRWSVSAEAGREILQGNTYFRIGSRYKIVRF